jgi:hypothetical protein
VHETENEADYADTATPNQPKQSPSYKLLLNRATFENFYMKLHLKLKDKFLVPKHQVDEIFEEINSIVKLSNDNLLDFIEKSQDSNSAAETLEHVKISLNEGNTLFQNAHNKLRYESVKKAWKENSAYWVEPREMALPYSEALNGVTTFQYIPILSSIKGMLTHEAIANKYFEVRPEKDANLITSFRDGSVYKNNKLFQEEPNAVELIVFTDECTLNNLVGDKRKNHKMSGTYFKLGKIL